MTSRTRATGHRRFIPGGGLTRLPRSKRRLGSEGAEERSALLMVEPNSPGPGRSTSEAAVNEVKKEIGRRNEEARRAARQRSARRARRSISRTCRSGIASEACLTNRRRSGVEVSPCLAEKDAVALMPDRWGSGARLLDGGVVLAGWD